MITPEQADELHRRMLAGSPTASAELAKLVFEDLVNWLCGKNPEVDESFITDACTEAFVNYAKNPSSFDASLRGLFGYLRMSAQGDLLNALEAARNQKKGKTVSNSVELDEIPRNVLSELAENTERDRVEKQIAMVFEDPRDREAALMIIDGDRESERFAKVLDCEHDDPKVQAQVVNRHKDRIKTAIKRKLGDGRE